MEDLKQEALAAMLGVVRLRDAKGLTGAAEAYLSGVAKKALATWWMVNRGREMLPLSAVPEADED